MADNDDVVGDFLTKGSPGLEPTLSMDAVRRIGPYELAEELGRGGMGVVYKACRNDDGTFVAIKFLSGHPFYDSSLRQRFLREARAAASISNPNIVRVHGIFEQETVLAIVMDYIPGGTLKSRIKIGQNRGGGARSACDVGWVVRIAKQIATGLAAAHAAGVVHRDIKPSNILLDSSGEHAWIADFGLAIFEIGDDSLTSTGRQLGTPAYMSPEQARGERVDRRSDLFSFGCLIYAMVTGDSPFHAANYMAIMNKICEYTPASLADRVPEVSVALAGVVERLLNKGAGDRYQSAEEVVEALNRFDDGSGSPPVPSAFDPAATDATSSLDGGGTSWGDGTSEGLPRYTTTIDAVITQPRPDDSPKSLPPRRKRLRRSSIVWFGVLTGSVLVASLPFWHRSEPAPGPREDAAATTPAGLRRTVSAERPADYTSLRDALDAAQPNDTIEVLDGATYDGPFVIDDPYRLEGVRLVSKLGATLRAEGSHGRMAVVTIDGVRRVRMEGFKVVGAVYLHSILLRGNVTGSALSGVHISQPPDAMWANVFLSRECRGTAEEPILIRECRFDSGKFGIYTGRDDVAESLELSHLFVDGNHFTGPGTHVVLSHSASDVRIEHNLFEGGRGIEMNLTPPRQSGPISILNNTFNKSARWINFLSDRPDFEGFASNNLIINTIERPWEDPFGTRRPSWRVEHNLWVSPGIKGVTIVEGFGRTTDDAELVSLDEASPDFLRPKAGGIAATAGGGPPQLGYVGARRP